LKKGSKNLFLFGRRAGVKFNVAWYRHVRQVAARMIAGGAAGIGRRVGPHNRSGMVQIERDQLVADGVTTDIAVLTASGRPGERR
jgi:hypothetical protein